MKTKQQEQNQRVKRAIKYLLAEDLGRNQRDLAEKLGYTESSFSQLLNGKTPISRPFLKKLYVMCPNLNPDWLENGEGEMFTNVNGSGNVIQAGIVQGNNTQNADCAEQLKMALTEISEQRKLYATHIDRLLSIIEKQNK